MAAIASYVFLDLETTGLPSHECNKTKITELSLIAVKRPHLLDTLAGDSPRIQHKLTLCFNPRKLVYPDSTAITGLCNELLENETPFNRKAFDTINNFLSLLTKPVCLISQNGFKFDYPILKKHLDDIGVSFDDDLMCADSLNGFYDILNRENKVIDTPSANCKCERKSSNNESRDQLDLVNSENALYMQKQNDSTPKKNDSSNAETSGIPRKRILDQSHRGISKVRRQLFWGNGPKPDRSYKLKDIYERLLQQPAIEAHRAENDCVMALECSVALSKDFVKWVDENHCPFTEIKPMTVGVRLGY